MEVNRFSGQQLPPQQRVQAPAPQQQQVMQQAMAQQAMQAQAASPLTGQAPAETPPAGISAQTRLSDLKAEDLSALGGSSALESLASTQGDLTVAEAMPLIRNPQAMESIAEILAKRPDLEVSDFVSRDMEGRVRIDPSYKDEETMKFLLEREDISPSEMSTMRENFTRQFRDPIMGKMATEKGIELMKQRPDLRPDDITKLMEQMGRATGMTGQNGATDQSAAGSALDMFDSASRLLTKRSDLQPEGVIELAKSVGSLGSPDDPNRAMRVAGGFDAAVKALEKNPLRQPEDMSRLAGVIGQNFKGQDENAAGARMNAFNTAAKMMGENPEVNADSINQVLTQAKKSNPKKNNRPQGLSGTLNDVAAGVSSGLVPGDNLGSFFNPQNIGVNPQAKTKKPGQPQQAGQPNQQNQPEQTAQPGQPGQQNAQGPTAATPAPVQVAPKGKPG